MALKSMKIKDKITLTIITIGAIPVFVCILNVYTTIPPFLDKLPKIIGVILTFGNLLVSSFILIVGAIILFFNQNKIGLKLLSVSIILFSIFWQYTMCKVEL